MTRSEVFRGEYVTRRVKRSLVIPSLLFFLLLASCGSKDEAEGTQSGGAVTAATSELSDEEKVTKVLGLLLQRVEALEGQVSGLDSDVEELCDFINDLDGTIARATVCYP